MRRLSNEIGRRGGVSQRAFGYLMAFKRDVQVALSERVESVLLFGSRARGDAKRHSDYDVAVLVHGRPAGVSVDKELANLAYRYLPRGVRISPVAIAAHDVRQDTRMPLGASLMREGIDLS